MRINRKLNLVIPVDTGNGTIYVHSTPISRDIFEKYFLVLSKTFAQIYQQGLNIQAGPRVAALLLKKIAVDSGEWDGPDGVQNGLVEEIKRLTNVVVSVGDWGENKDGQPAPKGWQTMPYVAAVQRALLDEDDIAEVENALCFFTCASHLNTRMQLPIILGLIASLWGALNTPLNSTEYSNSLPTLIETANFGETARPSSVPS